MATFESKKKAINDLDALAVRAKEAFDQRDQNGRHDLEACKSILNRYFYYIRFAHAYGVINDSELEKRLTDWNQNMIFLFHISPLVAFETACKALDVCSENAENFPCDIAIANSVSANITVYARPALQNKMRYYQYMRAEDAEEILVPLVRILISFDGHKESPNLQETFFEALTEFEIILASCVIPPTRRFEIVTNLKNLAEKRKNCDALLRRMNEILSDAVYLPDGRGLILHPLEVQADKLGQESKDWFQRNPIDIKSAFAIRAGLPVKYARHFESIEEALNRGNHRHVENLLYELVHRLAENTDEDSDSVNPSDIPVYSYLLSAADRLSKLSYVHGFQLAERCIIAIEDEMLIVEHLMVTVYGFSLPVISDAEGRDGQYVNRAKELYKVIMKRSSEFEMTKNAEDIFSCAADGFRCYLGGIHPVSRYDELFELSVWLKDRRCEDSLLSEFVDDLMNYQQTYGNKIGIPLEEDETAAVRTFPAPLPR